MSDITNRIDTLLTQRGLRRADICRATGLSESTIRTWVTRDAMPSAYSLYQVAQFFGVTVEYLLTGINLQEVPRVYMNNEEIEIIDIYRSLDQRGRDTLLMVAQCLDNKR